MQETGFFYNVDAQDMERVRRGARTGSGSGVVSVESDPLSPFFIILCVRERGRFLQRTIVLVVPPPSRCAQDFAWTTMSPIAKYGPDHQPLPPPSRSVAHMFDSQQHSIDM